MMFVGLMQLVDYGAWIDLDCTKGSNRLSSIIGPLLNHIQPLLFLLLAYYYLQSSSIVPDKLIVSLGVIYGVYMIYKYITYLNTNNLCIQTDPLSHLVWQWGNNYNYWGYHLLFLLGIINFYKYKGLLVFYIAAYILYSISIKSEIWCFLITGLPFLNLILQKIF
jgi:predicted transcriptional regulator with HTH domain